MGKNEAQIYGSLNSGPFETVGRTESWAEQRTATATIIGKADQLMDKVRPGDSMAKYGSWFGKAFSSQYYVKNFECSSEDGIVANLRMSLVKCGSGKSQPYNITWDVAMEEVQMPLINHPQIQKHCNLETLLKWENTPRGERIYPKVDSPKGLNDYEFQYRDRYDPSTGWGHDSFDDDKNAWEVAYCKARISGIETYNRYVPVISKNSYYLELPGAYYNGDHVITGGNISEFTGSDSVGRFDNPPISIKGYGSRDGLWFKSGDKYTSQADGSWVRTESWVYTPDKTHSWIYTNRLN